MKNLGLILALVATAAIAQDRTVPARLLPVPTDVSPQMQAIVSRPISPNFDVVPSTLEEWGALQAAYNNAVGKSLSGLQERLRVRVEETQIAGVTVYEVTPDWVAHENRDRLLIHIHGGCYVLGGGLAATSEAVMMAGIGHYKVISVDYRMPPVAYFPAALDDVVAVWREALKAYRADRMAVFRSSAGGAPTLEVVLRLKHLGLP